MPLFCPEKYAALGAVPPKSLLIRGISGVGKSFLVQCFCQQFQIPLITSIIDSSKDIKELFAKAKTADKSIILIKNIDSIMEEKNRVILLNECTKAISNRCIVVYCYRNIPEDIKYENEIFIKIPSLECRNEIFNSLIKDLKTSNIDTLEIAKHTPGFVPENMVKLVSMAVTNSLEREYVSSENNLNNSNNLNNLSNSNSLNNLSINMEDFIKAIKSWKNLEDIVTFDDIGAMNKIKEELTMSILLPSKFPEKFSKFGISKPSGLLLYGPPGCGKTLIAKAVSNMSHCNFLSIKGPELITKYVGDSEKHLRDLFQKAKNLSPCVLFFDEIDSLCGKRGKNEFGNRIVNQILTLLDGMDDRGSVYIIGATNRINSIDPALMRAGRFDKAIEVPLPSIEEAYEIFKKCVSKIPHDNFNLANLDLYGLSGADISGIVKESAILCLKENFDVPDLKVSEKYFHHALEKHIMMREATRKIKKKLL